MNPRYAATIALQAPSGSTWRDPGELQTRKVCPHCKRQTEVCTVFCDGHAFDAHRCRAHGDVVPILSHVSNESPP